MSKTTPLALAAAAALVGCPIPQPLPEYSPGAITPPRIVVDDSRPENRIAHPGTVVAVPSNCLNPPTYVLDAQIRDSNTIESIEARWFVNYDNDVPGSPHVVAQAFETVGPVPGEPTLRDIMPFRFYPYSFKADRITPGPGNTPGEIHVVELVVSNGFWSGPDEPLPNRSPDKGFEVQVYRWVFLNVPAATATCPVGDPLCAECP